MYDWSMSTTEAGETCATFMFMLLAESLLLPLLLLVCTNGHGGTICV
jgi:hypothetical protein